MEETLYSRREQLPLDVGLAELPIIQTLYPIYSILLLSSHCRRLASRLAHRDARIG